MKKKFEFGFLIMAFLSLCSCTNVMRTYVSNAPYVANLKSKSDLNLTGQIAINHVELQGAFAVTDKFALQGQVYSSVKGLNREVGALYFKNLGTKYFMEAYLGAGAVCSYHNQKPGSSFYSSDATKWLVETRADKYTAQFFAATSGAKYYFGVGSKLTYLSYSNYRYYLTKQEYYTASSTALEYIEAANYPQARGAVIEPFIHLGYRKKKWGFFIQSAVAFQSGFNIPVYRFSPNYGVTAFDTKLKMRNAAVNAGITYNINVELFKRKK